MAFLFYISIDFDFEGHYIRASLTICHIILRSLR